MLVWWDTGSLQQDRVELARKSAFVSGRKFIYLEENPAGGSMRQTPYTRDYWLDKEDNRNQNMYYSQAKRKRRCRHGSSDKHMQGGKWNQPGLEGEREA